jgi:arylsulfatase A-like enzyme
MIRQPLFIRVPKGKARRISAVAQPCDIKPTILDFFGIRTPGRCHGRSLIPLLKGRGKPIRKAAFTGLHGRMSLVTTDRWAYCCWLGQRPCALWDRKKDPDQKRNVARKNPAVVKRLHAELVRFFQSTGTDETYIERHAPKM